MFGQIYTWSLLGYGFVLADKKDLYFLHYSDIKEGMDLVAVRQPITFDVAPALPGKKYPRAINAVVGVPQPEVRQ
jgi:cold shock CspA family protein